MNTIDNIECPHCGFKVAVSTLRNRSFYTYGHQNIFFHGENVSCVVLRCANAVCNKESLWFTYSPEEGGKLVRKRLVPRSSAKPWPDYIPKKIRDDYEEACLILEDSPKASAALARRCLQGMIRDFWDINKNNLYKEIEAIQSDVGNEVYQALLGLKNIGNIGAHPETIADVTADDAQALVGAHPETIVDVTADDAQALVSLLHLLVEMWYIDREKRSQQLAKVTKLGKGKKRKKEEADINGTGS